MYQKSELQKYASDTALKVVCSTVKFLYVKCPDIFRELYMEARTIARAGGLESWSHNKSLPHKGADLVQEATIALYQVHESYLDSWLCSLIEFDVYLYHVGHIQTVYRHLDAYIRAQGAKRGKYTLEPFVATLPTPWETDPWKLDGDEQSAKKRIFSLLSVQETKICKLLFHGYTRHEIADVMKCSYSRICSIITRVREKIANSGYYNSNPQVAVYKILHGDK